MIEFVLGVLVGYMLGVIVMCLLSMTGDDCTGDCNQGRNCTCMEK